MGTKTEALLADEAAITEIDELRPLIAEGQERGFLTVEQIASSLEEVEVTKEQVAELHIQVGTPGLGEGTFAALAVEQGFPADLHPTIYLAVPGKADPGKVVEATFLLKGRC